MAFPLSVFQGALMGVAVNAFTNVINDRSPFDNALQSLLLGGVSGGIFGGAEGALPFGESTLAGNMSNLFGGAGSAAAGVGKGVEGATLDATSNVIPAQNLAGSSGNVSADLGSKIGKSTFSGGSTNPFGLSTVSDSYNFAPFGANPVYVAPPVIDVSVPAPGATGMSVQPANYLGGYTDQPISNVASKTSTATTSPDFKKDPFGYLTHKDNRGTAMLGGLGLAGAMGAFKPNTLNTQPKTASFYETTYNPPKFVTDPITGRVTYVAGSQGYGPGNRVTRNIATGGGIRALSGGGETAPYVPMTARGQMTLKEDVPDDLDDSAPIEKYSKYEINKKEKKGQAEIDKNVLSWLERYAKADVKGMAEGGPAQQVTQFQPTFSPAQQGIGSLQPYQAPNVPAMESSPTDYNQSPQYAPTQQYGASATSYSAPAANPMTTGLGSYLQGLEYKASPVTSPVTSRVTSPVAPPVAPPVASPVASPVAPPVVPPVAPPISEPPSWASNPGTSYNPLVNYDNYGSPLGRKDEPNIPDARPTYNDEGQISNTFDYFQDDEGTVKSIYDEDGIRKYNDDGSRVNEDAPAERREDVLARIQKEEPVVNSPASPITYDPVTQTYGETTPTPISPPPAHMGAGREGYSSGDDAGGGYGDGGGYDPVTQTYGETTPSPTIYNPATQGYSDNPAFTAPVAPIAKDSGSDSGYFYDDEGNRRSVYDEDGNRRYNDDGSSLYDSGDKAGGPITSKRYAMGGLAALPEYAAGGKLLSGDGDGMSDSIPAVIKGERPQRAALADGEFVIPADVVSHLGNGSTKAGGKRLYEMMANIRKARTGNSKQGKQINPMKFIPA